MVRRSFALLSLLLLAGCNAGAKIGLDNLADSPKVPIVVTNVVGAFLVADVGSMVISGRPLDDHISSTLTGKDCSIERWAEGRGPYCVVVLPPPPPPPVVARITYCYRSLASSTCYDRPVARDADGLIGVRGDLVAVAPE